MDKLASLPFDFKALEWGALLSLGSIVTSILLISAIAIVRGMLIRYIRKDSEVIDKEQRKWIIRIKNTSVILIVFGLFMIWAPQLHTFAISIAAFAVALVVATKEMILCLTGAVMRATSQPFKPGEWVTIDGVTGEVVDLDLFSFSLQEVDMAGKTYQFTGRTIIVPNSKLFTGNVENANFYKNYIYEDVHVTVQFTDLDPEAALESLKAIAEKYFAPFRKEAVSFNRKVRRRAGIDIAAAEPSFDLTTSDLGHYKYHVRLFLPTPIAANVGYQVSRDFLSTVHKMRGLILKDAKEGEEASVQPKEADAAPVA